MVSEKKGIWSQKKGKKVLYQKKKLIVKYLIKKKGQKWKQHFNKKMIKK